MRLHILLILLALLLVPALSEEEEEITITDEDGRNVAVPLDPDSIICLSPAAAEVIYALGEPARIVAVTEDCDMPPALLEKSISAGPVAMRISREFSSKIPIW